MVQILDSDLFLVPRTVAREGWYDIGSALSWLTSLYIRVTSVQMRLCSMVLHLSFCIIDVTLCSFSGLQGLSLSSTPNYRWQSTISRGVPFMMYLKAFFHVDGPNCMIAHFLMLNVDPGHQCLQVPLQLFIVCQGPGLQMTQ